MTEPTAWSGNIPIYRFAVVSGIGEDPRFALRNDAGDIVGEVVDLQGAKRIAGLIDEHGNNIIPGQKQCEC